MLGIILTIHFISGLLNSMEILHFCVLAFFIEFLPLQYFVYKDLLVSERNCSNSGWNHSLRNREMKKNQSVGFCSSSIFFPEAVEMTMH